MIDVKQRFMTCVQVRTYLRIDAAGTLAPFADVFVATAHAVHISRRSAQVTQIPFEVGHLDNLLDLPQYALFGT